MRVAAGLAGSEEPHPDRPVARSLCDVERGGLVSRPAPRAVKGARLEVVADSGRESLS